MNNSLDKLIGNDELLTYICLILGIFNTFLMSMVITGIKHNFNIYIFLLFEALFLIFIVYFILKKKDVYSKDDDIKYDWYFYLRISIITLAFFNFSLYIYNITNDSSTNPRKNGGGRLINFPNPIKYFKDKFLNKNMERDNEISILKRELASIFPDYKKNFDKIQSSMQDSKKNDDNIQLLKDIAPTGNRIAEINARIKVLENKYEPTNIFSFLSKRSPHDSTARKTTGATREESRATRGESRATREESRATREESRAARAARATARVSARAARASRATPTNKVFPILDSNDNRSKY